MTLLVKMRIRFKKTLWRATILLITIVVFIFGGLIFFFFRTEFTPPQKLSLQIANPQNILLQTKQAISLLSWNIGYGGLGEKMDFFYDGGTQVTPDAIYFSNTWKGITGFLSRQTGTDIFLLQEVDIQSKRSHYLNEQESVQALFPRKVTAFAVNYQCRFVPIPLANPMGKVVSGLFTLSSWEADSAIRFGYDVHPPWPDRLFHLKRCFLATFIPLANDKSLIVLNIHNSAFDTGGVLRRAELNLLSWFMISQVNKGNYVIAGGDWNANPPGFSPDKISTGDRVMVDDFTDLTAWFPGWTFAYDAKVPTNRHVDEPYEKGVTETSILDFFVVSPNLTVDTVFTQDLGFAFSDHNPVFIKLSWP